DDVDVVTHAVAGGAEKGDLAPGVRPHGAAVQGLAVSEQFGGGLAEALIINLSQLVAAHVLEVHISAAAGIGRKCGMRDRLAQKGELAKLACRPLHEMQLVDIAETSGDQQLALRREAE